MANLAELESINPNLGQQLAIWRQERTQRGEDGYDYQAFRQHVLAIGAPDPGEQAFDEFGVRESVSDQTAVEAPPSEERPADIDRSSRGGPRAE